MAILRRNLKNSQPLLKNNFIVTFPTSYDIPSWLVQTASLPKIKIDEIEVPFFNTSQFMHGRYLWEPIDVTFIAPIGPSTNQKLMEVLRLAAENYTSRMGYVVSYKFDLALEYTDPVGGVVSKWMLYDCQIGNFEFDEFDYGAGEILKPKVTIRPDYCELLY